MRLCQGRGVICEVQIQWWGSGAAAIGKAINMGNLLFNNCNPEV